MCIRDRCDLEWGLSDFGVWFVIVTCQRRVCTDDILLIPVLQIYSAMVAVSCHLFLASNPFRLCLFLLSPSSLKLENAILSKKIDFMLFWVTRSVPFVCLSVCVCLIKQNLWSRWLGTVLVFYNATFHVVFFGIESPKVKVTGLEKRSLIEWNIRHSTD